MELPLKGGCVCGAVRYEIAQEPLCVYACHCTDCQRFTGSAFAVGVVVASEAFQVMGAATRLVPNGVTEGGRRKSLMACPECGTRLFSEVRPDWRSEAMVRSVLGDTGRYVVATADHPCVDTECAAVGGAAGGFGSV